VQIQAIELSTNSDKSKLGFTLKNSERLIPEITQVIDNRRILHDLHRKCGRTDSLELGISFMLTDSCQQTLHRPLQLLLLIAKQGTDFPVRIATDGAAKLSDSYRAAPESYRGAR
jgi:hypothetical protein